MNENGKLLTIGQFAALHGINKKTLMWYDEIGLLSLLLSIQSMDTAAIIIIKVPY